MRISSASRRLLKAGLLRGQAAVYNEPCAGHKAGVIRGEKNNALGDVVGHAEPANWVGRQCDLSRGIDIVGSDISSTTDKSLFAHVGLNDTRMDRIHPDAVALASELERRRF